MYKFISEDQIQSYCLVSDKPFFILLQTIKSKYSNEICTKMAYYVLNGDSFENREVLLIIKNTLCQRSFIITRRALLDCPSWYYVEVFSSTSEPSLYPVETATIISCSYVNFLSCYSQLIATPVRLIVAALRGMFTAATSPTYPYKTRYVSSLMSSGFNQSRSKLWRTRT